MHRRTHCHGAVEAGRIVAGKLRKGSAGAVNAYPNHILRCQAILLSGSHTAEDALFIEGINHPMLIVAVLGKHWRRGREGTAGVGALLGRIENIVFRKARCQQRLGGAVGTLNGGR